jgi:tetratricopeptide (TPR) repeat protein
MPEKKRSSVSRAAEERMSEGPATGNLHPPDSIPALSTRPAAAAIPHSLDGQKQLAVFEAAMKLFHVRNLKEARGLFAQASAGPQRDVAQRARLHIAMCDRRLESPPVALGTAEDYYNYGIALLNVRNTAAAVEHLGIALRLEPGSDHIHYALGLALALSGDLGGAYENLKRAIELEPRNRAVARQDADIAHLAGQPPFEGLLYPEKKGW